MRGLVSLVLVALLSPAMTAGAAASAAGATLVPLPTLERLARARVGSVPRFELAPADAEVFKGLDTGMAPDGQVPNYLRALAALPNTVAPFARLVRAAVYSGRVAPEVKLGMGLRVAQVYGSPYTAAHMQRALGRTGRGRAVLAAIEAGNDASLPAADRLALRYADLLTRDVHGVTEADFEQVRGRYDDSQIVELTMTVCFFNYFTRLCEGLALPVEPWALEAATPASAVAAEPGPAIVPRVALISDPEIAAVAEASAAAKAPTAPAAGLGLGMANSQRAMLRAPEFATAWRAYGTAVRQYATVERSTALQVSFAVSMANGCRYCTIHQVLGLRRLGVDVGKLVAMKKDDEALTPRELVAVKFARKLTSDPLSASAADYAALRTEFGEQGALEMLLQTCAFSFMNRFTDGLRLPSEDEAVRVYREVYGPQAY
jgi:AhpD family alkylhydroperoxidase